MFDIEERDPNLECEVCDDYDHCMPRWEDDGGSAARPPLPSRPLAERTGRDHEHLDQPPVGERRQEPG